MKNLRLIAGLILLVSSCSPSAVAEMITPAIDNTGTIIRAQSNRFDIQGGTQVGNNLFHSFSKFNLNRDQTANFISNPSIQTILGRVVGGDASQINGLLQVTGGTSNLFLINPAGIIFGTTARLNVPASFTATTANAIQFGSPFWFNSVGANDYASLTSAPTQLAFLTRNPGWIVQAGELAVARGQSISLVGGIVINTGTLSAPGGRITIAAVPGSTAVRITPSGSVLNLDIPLIGIQAENLSLPKLLTGGQLESATGVQVENGVIRLTGAAVPVVEGSAIASGTISAPDGFVETSGKTNLDITGINLSAKTWLIDPSNINITTGGTGTLSSGLFDPLTPTATISPNTIATALNAGTNVIITTSSGSNPTGGDITLSNSINQLGNGSASLTLTGRRFIRPGTAVINLTSTGGLTFNINQVNPELNPPASSIQDALDAIGTVNGNRNINLGGGTYTTNTPISWINSANINGEIGVNTIISGNNATRIFEIDPGVSARLQDLAIVNGRVGAGQSGGAIENLGNLTLIRSTVANSQAGLDGGGISTFGAGATLTVVDSTIRNNQAQYGGGLSSTNDTVTTITSSAIRNNTATEGGGGIENTDGASLSITDSGIVQNTARYGGGFTLFRSANVVIQQATIADNIAQDYGGGIASDQDVSVSMNQVTIARNRVTNGSGGGIWNNSPMRLNLVTIADNQAGTNGGGIDNKNTGVLEIRGGTFSRNSASQLGGGIYSNGKLDIFTTTLSENTAGWNGGGIYNSGIDGVLAITDSQLLSNRAGDGGAIETDFNGSATISNSILADNIATLQGGAICSGSTARLTIVNSQILRNQALAGDAGGVNAYANTLIQNSTISGNSAVGNGGGICSGNTLDITNSTISNNVAAKGGGIFNLALLKTANSTISGNRATEGGGLFIDNGTATLNSNTIANNQATSSTGGIFNLAGLVNLQNTIVAGNQSDVSGVFSDRGNNLIGISNGSTGFTLSTLVGTASTPIDPLLAPLANNGGTTNTHALLLGSPAINVGNNATATAFDQRGATRIQQAVIDIGAFETNFPPPVPPTPPVVPPTPPTPPVVPPTPPVVPPTPPVVPPTPSAPSTPPTPLTPTPAPPTPQQQILNPTNLVRSEIPLEGPIQRTTEAKQSLAIASDLDHSLTNDYAQYYNLKDIPQLTLKDAQDRLARAEHQTKVRSAIIYAVFTPQALTPAPKQGERLADSIEPITPLLRSHLKRDDDRLELILVTATGHATRFSTTVMRSQVVQQAQLFRLAVADPEDEQSYKALSQQLYGWLVQQLEPTLQQEKITSLIYCMDEGLRTIPIAAMTDGQTSILDRYTVSIIPSVALLNSNITQLSNRSILAMGADRFTHQSPLPAVPTELEFVSEQFWKGARSLNQDFTLNRLLQQKSRHNPGILHLATHADFRAGAPQQSYIQFWDNQLKFNEKREITQTVANIELLVLSACKTALGSPEAELGFAGFAAASGVPSVLGSLWEVSDLGTLALMSEFYIQLQQAPTRAEALRRSQKALREGRVRIENGTLITTKGAVTLPTQFNRDRSKIILSHPFYWSAFTLVGNPW